MMTTFEALGITERLLKSIEELGFDRPTPIQAQVIPLLLNGNGDVIGLAQTGTGKTAAFGLPIVQRIDPGDTRTQALILAPTRELCQQISSHMKRFAGYVPGLQIVTVYGGADMVQQIKALKRGAQIIVATPGRMNDLLNKQKKIDLSFLRTVVLDEADEMLDMGFKEELDAILERTPVTRQTLLFSATMPDQVLRISKAYMRDPEVITIGRRNAGVEQIDHICYTVPSKDRYLALKRIVDFNPDIYGIVFCRTRAETKEVAEKLIQDGYNAEPLHGELTQPQREAIMGKFRAKTVQMLVATDVAARGLDVKNLTHIISYNLPDDLDGYTHRSGRTGRAGGKGTSVALVNLKEKHKIKQIESRLRIRFEWRPVPGGHEICEKQLLNLVDRMRKIEIDHKEIDKFLPAVSEKLEWLTREELIKHFVSLEFNRLLDYYKDAKDLNEAEPEQRPGRLTRRDDARPRGDGRMLEKKFVRFHINLGYKDSMTPRDLIELVKRCVRKPYIDIGRIDLMKTYAIFEVDQREADAVLAGFRGIEYNRREVAVRLYTEENVRRAGRKHGAGVMKRPQAGKRNMARKKAYAR